MARINFAVMPSSIGLAEAWISIALGVLLLFIFPNTIRYIHSPADFEQNNPVTDAQDNTIRIRSSAFSGRIWVSRFLPGADTGRNCPGGGEENRTALDRICGDGPGGDF